MSGGTALDEPSGERRRLGHISKQGGNTELRFLLVEAAQVRVSKSPRWRNQFSTWRYDEEKRSRK